MNDARPDIAIGHVRLSVGNVAHTTEFFVKLGIRTIVEQEDFAVLNYAVARISCCAPGKSRRPVRSVLT